MKLCPQEFKKIKIEKKKKQTTQPTNTKPQIPSSEYTHFKMTLANQKVWGPPSMTILKDSSSFSKGSLQNCDFYRSAPKAGRTLNQSAAPGQNRLIKRRYFIIFPKTTKMTFLKD